MDDLAGITDANATPRSAREPLLFAFWFVSAGIIVDHTCKIALQVWIFALVGALLLWCLMWTRRLRLSWLPLGVAIACLFGAWHFAYWHVYPDNQIVAFTRSDATPACLRAVVQSHPQNVICEEDPISATISPEQATFTIEALAVRETDGSWQQVSGRCRARVRGHVKQVAAGDQIILFGELSRAGPPMNPGAWDPSHHARLLRLLCRLDVEHPGCITVVSSPSAWNPRWWLPRLRGALQTALLKHIEGPAGGLAVAVLLGAREFVPQSTIDSFLVTGTVHLLAISGLHVGILAFSLLYGLTMLRVSRPLALWSVMVFCLVYACLTGGRAPVIRAAVIVWVACLGLLWYRPNFSFNSLAAAGIIVLVINPAQLFAPGAQLSFVAVAAIIWIVPKLSDATAGRISRLVYRHKRSLARMTIARRLRKMLTIALASIVIWLVALPLVMYHFHLVSPIALLLNTFAWIPLWAALLSGFATMLVAWLPTPVVAVPAAVCQVCIDGLTGLVRIAEQLPGSHFWVSGPPIWSVVGFYGLVAACLAFPVVRRSWKRCLASASLLFFVSWTVTGQIVGHRAQPLALTFLSVGHGTCVIIELPDKTLRNRFWIYDAGRLGTSRYAVQEISNFLWSRGARHIEGLLMSHADVDHFNAIPGLADRFSIGTIYTTTPFLHNRQPAASMLLETLADRRVPIHRVSAGDTIAASEQVELRILHPHDRFVGITDNEDSIVVCLEHQGRRILLPGDLEGAGMERLLAGACLDCDLVMAPHHGSYRSEPERFCDWATPEWVVISGGHRGMEKGLRLFERSGATVLRTTEHGAVEARIDDGVLRVTSHRSSDQQAAAQQ